MIDVPKITCQLLRRAPIVEPQMAEELVEVPGLLIQDVVLGVVEQIDDVPMACVGAVRVHGSGKRKV